MRNLSVALLLAATGVAMSGTATAADIRDGVRMAPSFQQRPVPPRGTHRSVVEQMFGTPAARLTDPITNSDMWDYGTFRVFFVDDAVEFARAW